METSNLRTAERVRSIGKSGPNMNWQEAAARSAAELLQQSKHSDSRLCANKDFAIHNDRSDELVARAELVARTCLIAVVQLISQIRGIEGMQHCRVAVLHRPHDSVRGSVGRHRGRRSRILERSAAL